MSEYQYHEWQAVDRVLTYEEQAAVIDRSLEKTRLGKTFRN